MAKQRKGQVTLNGRFPAGARVRLVAVDGDHVLRSEGGEEVASATVGDDGSVSFDGLTVGDRFFVVGHIAGVPREARVTAREADDNTAGLAQAPVTPDRVRLGDGSWEDEVPEAAAAGDGALPGGPAQQHARDVEQRSATARGYATPVDPDERGPYPDQQGDGFKDGKIEQRSDTELGMATPIADRLSQEQVGNDVAQRSSTPRGVATPLVPGSPIDAARQVQSAEARAMAGDPQQAAAIGLDPADPPLAADAKGEKHEDRYPEDYVPVAPGQDTPEGRPGKATGTVATSDQLAQNTALPAGGVADASPLTGGPADEEPTPPKPKRSRSRRSTASTSSAPLAGEALQARARELDIKGRGSKTAAQLRAAIKRAEKKR